MLTLRLKELVGPKEHPRFSIITEPEEHPRKPSPGPGIRLVARLAQLEVQRTGY